MQKPKIEQEIRKRRNRVISVVGFLGLGMGALAATKGLGALPLCFIAIPLAIDSFTLHHLSNDNYKKYGLTLYKPFFQLGIKRWINKYLEKSKNVHEKKYKYMLLSSWLEHKNIPFDDISFSDFNIFEVLQKEMRKGNVSNQQLQLLSSYHIMGYNRYEKFAKILEEDKQNTEIIEIAKEVYKEYFNSGIAGKSFINQKEFSAFVTLQNYKFTPKDYELIDSTKIVINDHPLFRIDIKEYSDESKKALHSIVENEEDINNLNILKNFCIKKLEQADEVIDSVDSLKKLKQIVEKKIEYIELGKELEVIKNTTKKSNRTKL